MLKNSSERTFSDFSFLQSKSLEQPTFFDLAKMKFLAVEGPQTL